MIVENEQNGNIKADYGRQVLKELSKRLIQKFGKGFSVTSLKFMRRFYLFYRKGQIVSDQFRNNEVIQSVSGKSDGFQKCQPVAVKLDADEKQ